MDENLKKLLLEHGGRKAHTAILMLRLGYKRPAIDLLQELEDRFTAEADRKMAEAAESARHRETFRKIRQCLP